MTELRAVKIIDKDGESVDVQNPLPVNLDSVYAQDIILEKSSSDNFTGGNVLDFFNDLNTTLVNATTDNPKTIILSFNRAVAASGISLGDANGGTHSGIKVEALRGGDQYFTLNDNSSSVIPFNSRFYSFSVSAGLEDIGIVSFTGLRITFNTASTVSISNIIISKTNNVIASLQGLKPSGETAFIGASNNSNLNVSVNEYGDTPSIDSFARLRISENFTIFDSKQLHDKQPLFWDEQLTGSATSTHSSVDADVEMNVTANINDSVIRQTKQRFNYQPGKSQLVYITFMGEQIEGLTKRVGYFDGIGVNNLTPNNGIFFETNGDISWNIAKNGVITESISRDNWNVDKLDGTGASKINLETSSAQILIIDFEWLGVGRVRVGFVIDGLIYYCHYFNHANDPSFPNVYMSSPNLPLRYSIESDGTASGELKHICSSVISEGGAQKTGVLRVVDTGNSYVTGLSTGTSYSILGIRLKQLYKDITIIPEGLSIALGTNDSFKWSLQLNPTIGTPPSFNGLADSAIEGAVGSSANVVTTDGIVISSGYASTTTRQADADLNTALRIGSTIAGVQDELYLVITPLSTNLSVAASLNFRELL